MIKTVFVPLMVKSSGYGHSPDQLGRVLAAHTANGCQELDEALDDGWRILDKQYIDSAHDSGVVFFLRDDAECLLITEEGLAALEAEAASEFEDRIGADF